MFTKQLLDQHPCAQYCRVSFTHCKAQAMSSGPHGLRGVREDRVGVWTCRLAHVSQAGPSPTPILFRNSLYVVIGLLVIPLNPPALSRTHSPPHDARCFSRVSMQPGHLPALREFPQPWLYAYYFMLGRPLVSHVHTMLPLL